jgi:hypothetical protein
MTHEMTGFKLSTLILDANCSLYKAPNKFRWNLFCVKKFCGPLFLFGRWSNSVNTVSMCCMTRAQFPAQAKDFSVSLHVQSSSGAHPASYPLGTGSSFPRCKAAGHKYDHSPSSNAKVKSGAILSHPICLHGLVLSKYKR